MLLSCKGRAGLVVNVTTIIPQTDKAFRVSLAIKLRVLDRLLNIDGRLSWVVNCAHLTLCAAAQHFRKSCDGPCGGEEIRKTGRGLPQYSVRGWVRQHFSVITGGTLVPKRRFVRRSISVAPGAKSFVYQDHQISFFPPLLLEAWPRGKVRHKHNKSPRKPGMVSCSGVQVSARYIDADLGGFWARSRCLFR